jgi:hypothetical protein
MSKVLFRRIKYLIWLLILVLTPQSLADSPADAWENAVKKLIPLSFDIAQNQARVRESTVFVHALGQAQSHLSHAYDSVAAFEELRSLLSPQSSLKDDSGNVQLDLVLQQLVVTSQLVEARRLVKENVAEFQKLKSGLNDSCDSDFSDYQVDTTFIVPQAPAVNDAEGVYVECCDIPRLIQTLGTTVSQIWTNEEQNRRISEQTDLLLRKRAHDSDYRKFASQQCAQLKTTYTGIFGQYEPLGQDLDKWLGATSDAPTIHSNVRALLDEFAEAKVKEATLAAQKHVREQIIPGGQDAYLQRVRLSEISIVRVAVETLQNLPCDEDAKQKIVGAVSIAQLLSLPDGDHLKADAQKAVSEAVKQCGRKSQASASLVLASDRDWVSYYRRPRLAAQNSPLVACRIFGGPSTFCQDLFTETSAAKAPIGFYTTREGGVVAHLAGYAYTSEAQGTLVYAPQDPWPTYRGDFARPFIVPGSTYSALAKAEETRLDAFIRQLSTYNNSLKNVSDGLAESAKKFSSTPLPHATQSAMDHIEDLAPASAEALKSIRETFDQDIVPSSAPPAAFSFLATPALLQSDAELEEHISEKSKETWKKLETLWRARNFEPSTLSTYDRDAMSTSYGKHFNEGGVYRGTQESTLKLASQVASSIASPLASPTGTDVRLAASKSLFAYDNTTGKDREIAEGSIGLALGADAAYQAGSSADGDRLLRASLGTADLALGFIPVVSSINDATQIVFGIVTGHDYAGRRMTSADFAMRGVGVVVGLLPASAIVRLGGAAISRSFLEGSQIIREMGFGSRVATALKSQRQLAARFATGIGIVLGEGAASDLAAARGELERAVTILERPLGEPGTAEYVSLLKNSGQKDAKQFIDSFEPSKLRFDVAVEERTFYRWHNNDAGAQQFGRFVSTDLIEDPNLARTMLDLPESNRALYLDEFKVATGTPVFEGPVRVAEGAQAGNQVFLVTRSPKSVLTFVRRIKP